jgi:hypothetical protein
MSLAAKVYSTPAQLATAMLGSGQDGGITKLLSDWELGDAGNFLVYLHYQGGPVCWQG